ncbi:MAG: hypothetical protein ACRD6X_17860 [Pyrinomonadaceae bacterium]
MFESSEVKEQKHGAAFWFKIGGGVIVLLVILNTFRVNLPEAAEPAPLPSIHTEGKIADGRTVIEPGGFWSYRVNFNYSAAIKGYYRVAGGRPKITFVILDAANFEKWSSGSEFLGETSIRDLASGQFERKLNAGEYFLVFDNRNSQNPAVLDLSIWVK